MEIENLTLPQALAAAKALHEGGFVAISVLNSSKHTGDVFDESAYWVSASTPKQHLEHIVEQASLSERSIPEFEVVRNYVDGDGVSCGRVIAEGETTEELLNALDDWVEDEMDSDPFLFEGDDATSDNGQS